MPIDSPRGSPKKTASSRLPPLRAIRVFEAVGRCGSVRDAALELRVSSSAVTQQIQLLEKFLHTRLVQRGNRGMKLTPMGVAYHGYVVAAMEQLHKGARNLEQLQHSNQLMVSAFPSFISKWLGPLALDWKQSHPDVELVLDGADPEPSLDDGEADFRISYGTRSRFHTRFVELFRDHVVPACSPALLKDFGRPREPRDMVKLPLLDVDWGPEFPEFPHWTDWLEHYGPATRARAPQMTFSLASASIDAAIEGRGAVLAQHSLAARALADGSLIALFDLTLPLPESYFVAWSLTAREKPAGAAFYAWLNQRRVTATKSPST